MDLACVHPLDSRFWMCWGLSQGVTTCKERSQVKTMLRPGQLRSQGLTP